MSLLVLLTACTEPAGEAAQDSQLEAARVSSPACEEGECLGDEVASGTLAVATEGKAVSMTVGDVSFTVHSPTSVDLSPYAGGEVSAFMAFDWMAPASLQLTDGEGLLYVVEAGDGSAFEAVDVSPGDELGSLVDDADYERTFHRMDVVTDDGTVSVAPGEVVGVTLDGGSYRFGAIAAYEVDTIEGGDYSDCGGELPMMSYEMVRVPAPVAAATLHRDPSDEAARYSGCGG
jgi:hypothetical protein